MRANTTHTKDGMEHYDAIVMFDACQNAWAARVFFPKSGRMLRVMKAFAAPLQHSAHAEPTAAKEVCSWMKRKHPHVKKVALVTDHEALANGQRRWWSGNGGFSTAFHLNAAFRETNGYAEIFHVQGKENLCDGDSRSAEAAACRTIRYEVVNEVFPDLNQFVHPWLVRPVVAGF